MIQDIKPKLNQEYYTNEDFPIYAAEWIKENLDLSTIKLFNEYNYGSYLLFQGIPVMIDSRADLYSPEFNATKDSSGIDIFMDVQNVCTGDAKYTDVFKYYGITHVITYSDSSLNSKLKKDKNYKKIYPNAQQAELDERFIIYEKVSSDNDESQKDDTEAISNKSILQSNKTIESNQAE